jgi:hypothetical protein
VRESPSYSIRAIDRAIQVLDCFSFQQREHTMGELARETRLSKSTVFRILQTLEKHKWVVYDPPSNRYSLGMKLLELGGIVFSSISLRVPPFWISLRQGSTIPSSRHSGGGTGLLTSGRG